MSRIPSKLQNGEGRYGGKKIVLKTQGFSRLLCRKTHCNRYFYQKQAKNKVDITRQYSSRKNARFLQPLL